MAQESQTGTLYQPKEWDGAGDGRAIQKVGDICISSVQMLSRVLLFVTP